MSGCVSSASGQTFRHHASVGADLYEAAAAETILLIVDVPVAILRSDSGGCPARSPQRPRWEPRPPRDSARTPKGLRPLNHCSLAFRGWLHPPNPDGQRCSGRMRLRPCSPRGPTSAGISLVFRCCSDCPAIRPPPGGCRQHHPKQQSDSTDCRSGCCSGCTSPVALRLVAQDRRRNQAPEHCSPYGNW